MPVSEVPKKIWLQIDPKGEWPQWGVTWSQHKENPDDVLYIKAGRPKKNKLPKGDQK